MRSLCPTPSKHLNPLASPPIEAYYCSIEQYQTAPENILELRKRLREQFPDAHPAPSAPPRDTIKTGAACLDQAGIPRGTLTEVVGPACAPQQRRRPAHQQHPRRRRHRPAHHHPHRRPRQFRPRQQRRRALPAAPLGALPQGQRGNPLRRPPAARWQPPPSPHGPATQHDQRAPEDPRHHLVPPPQPGRTERRRPHRTNTHPNHRQRPPEAPPETPTNTDTDERSVETRPPREPGRPSKQTEASAPPVRLNPSRDTDLAASGFRNPPVRSRRAAPINIHLDLR